MSEQLYQKAKNVVLLEIRKTLPNTGTLQITVESHGGVEYFQQALEDPEVKEALNTRQITAVIKVIDPLSEVKNHLLQNLRRVATGETKPVMFQALEQDSDLYYAALKLPEVTQVIERKKLKIQIQVIGKDGRIKPDIVVASFGDIASGRLKDLL